MNIVSTQYTLSTKSLEIYLAGCNGQPKCKGCHNKQLWDFNIGENFNYQYFNNNILKKYNTFKEIIKNIMIFGGEPLDQPYQDLSDLLYELNLLDCKLWLFTRYEINDVDSMVKKYCDYIKCGKYDEDLLSDDNIQYGIKLATSNQRIYKKGIDY